MNLYYDNMLLPILNESYSNFIVGSDQVWNPLFWSDIEKEYKTYFLRFADEQKRIAYAASFGISELPKNTTICLKKA